MPDLTGFSVRRETTPTAAARYLPVPSASRGATFHTSYYRTPFGPVDRYLTSVYDFTYERYFEGWSKRVHHFQKRNSILAADMAICNSASTRADLLSYFPQVDPARTCVVPHGVDQQMFYPDPETQPGRPYVLFIGQRVGYKRFDLAISTVERLPDIALAVAGPHLTQAEKAHLELRLPGRWTEHAAVSSEKLRRLYSSAYAFVFPSDYEGFGLPILEAMACGCPVVAANRSSFPEVTGTAALLADAQDPDAYATLLRRLENEDRRNELIEAGHRRADLFNWDSASAQIWELYR
ncbi:glycosyltransferase family 4 protein [Altericroceibacterium xinjiangense]|uniref:glycosyltransferase family 4 protein n=1 Tax=Altericroceibacterium xinjiangense TaxID=762261 RepID=UPI0024088BE6|nr:glycosyltransferase family 1 protein [Altericroceibacterium xinjiangense]